MIPGPVFQFELLTTARRGRFYLGRAAYALGLLVVFWVIHADWTSRSDVELTPKQMSTFALVCFVTVAVAQVVLVLCLTPALVAGVIADEKQRRTLHYLLSSRLSGPEIVIGKLLARMLHVAVLVAVGFPVLSLLVLLGGIDPRMIVLACGAAASTAWFLAALSIWVSTIARKARDALFVTYGLEFLWLFIPVLVVSMPSTGWLPLDMAVGTAYDAWVSSSPFGHARQWAFGFAMGTWNPLADLPEMVVYQVVGGLLLAALAAIQLRPVFRAQEGGPVGRRRVFGWLTGKGSPRRWFRPALGDHPMLWKELFTARARGFVRFVAFLVTLVGGGSLAYYTIKFGGLALQESWDYFGVEPNRFWYPNMHRYRFQWFLQAVVPLVYIAGLLSVAGAAAASITSEHEQDTWTSLTSTDLTGREILLAKLLGALWRPRGIVLVILLMTLMGAISGAIHGASLVPLVMALGVYGWFAAALGVWISLHLRSTWRAQFLTTSGLLLFSLLGQAMLSNVRRYAPLLWPGFTPYEISKCLLPPTFLRDWQGQAIALRMGIPNLDGGPVWELIFWLVSLACYLAGSIGLTLLALRKFEDVAGRARRSRATDRPASAGDVAVNVPDRRYRGRWIGLGVLAAALLGLRAWLMREADWPPRLVLRTGGVSWDEADRQPGRGRKVSVPAAFSPDSSLLAVAEPGRVTVWDTASGRKSATWTMPGGRTVYEGRFSPDGRTFAALSWDGKAANLTLELVEVATGQVRASLPAPGGGIVRGGLAFRDEARRLRAMVVDSRNAVHVVDFEVASGQLFADRTLDLRIFHNSTHAAPGGRLLAFAPPQAPGSGPGPELVLWDLDQEREVARLAGNLSVEAAGLSDDGRSLAIARPGNAIEVREREELSPRAVLHPHSLAVHPALLEFSPDGRILASAGYRGASTFAQALVIAGLSVLGGSPASSEGELAVVESATGHILLRTMQEGSPCFSPDGRLLATIRADGTIVLRDLRSGR